MSDELFTLAAATSGAPAAAPFGRVSVAMVTPFLDDGGLDLEGTAALAEKLVADGCDGIVVGGTTGESPTTSDAEKDLVLRAVLEAVGGRARVVAGVGTYDTRHTGELAQAAQKAGAHGLLVVTPYYSRPPQEALYQHFTAIASATDLPVMLYDIPARTGVPIATETLVRLAEHDRIVAVKDAKGDVFASSEVMARTGLAYYSGDDALNLALLTHGAVGMVSVVGHVAAAEYAQMVRAVDSGDLPRALGLHRRLIPAVRGIMTRTQGAIMAKAAVELRGVIRNRTVRSPLIPATDEQVAQLRADLAEAGLA
ncbi:4-hydroxy-tetrahydrodipicolinate synthase [Jiangella anatolica]|uniref:4-hydroxy-tetrahydrodipicolinate synthase n=1 Tax=Jiangella anatolica TaxID=2670374 RepID=A0A2W2AZU9_9ACTN|nr:4-hydroxy-tetrahydrodipicolinate synthase [Jiangella anatolica]PZF80715.1 4-hydroxy-tetrahydrodipicolinate synthase [Jiangella anatolica]